MSVLAAKLSMTTEKQAMRALRGHLSGQKIGLGKGLHPGAPPGKAWGTTNHIALGVEVYFAGDPAHGADQVIDFYSKQLTDGFWYTDRLKRDNGDESGSTSHDHVHESAAGLGLLLAERGTGGAAVAAELKGLLIRWWRSWLIDCALHRAPRKLGKPGGIRFQAVDRAGGRYVGEVDQTEVRARAAAYLLDGTRMPPNVEADDALDMTGMWCLKRLSPETLAAIRRGIYGAGKASLPLAELPRTHNAYTLRWWGTGHLGVWLTTDDMDGAAKWTLSNGGVVYGTGAAPVPLSRVPKGAAVIDYPLARQAAQAAFKARGRAGDTR